MSTLFGLLLLASSSAFLIGLFKPSLVKTPTRKHSSLIYGSGAIAFMIASAITMPEQTSQQTEQTEQTNTTSELTDSNSGKEPKANTDPQESNADSSSAPQAEDQEPETNTDPQESNADSSSTPQAEDQEPETNTEPQESKKVTRSQFKKDWPLTVKSGYVDCTDQNMAIFRHEGQVYALNETAIQEYQAIDPILADKSDPIWEDHPDPPKKNIKPLLDRALQECN